MMSRSVTIALLLLVAGCGRDLPDMVEVRGTVTFVGGPCPAQGKIFFGPIEAAPGFSLRPASAVFGVLTFYAQFRLTPQGRNLVRVCRGTACHVRGSPRILQAVERSLDIRSGETTADLEYTLETVACIGACALAPVTIINDSVHGQMSATKVEELFSEYGGGKDG